MRFIPGLSYGAHTGSLAYPKRVRSKRVHNNDMLSIVVDHVHPGNLGALPPSPSMLAYKGEVLGLAKYGEFFNTIWY